MCAFRTIIQLLRQEASNMFRKGIFMPERELAAPNDGSDTVLSKCTAKDSVFTDLFRHPKYLLQLYQALHPEDTDASEDKINNITLNRALGRPTSLSAVCSIWRRPIRSTYPRPDRISTAAKKSASRSRNCMSSILESDRKNANSFF